MLQELGLKYCRAKCKSKRLAFAKKYVNMPISFWRKIIWSDESNYMWKKKIYIYTLEKNVNISSGGMFGKWSLGLFSQQKEKQFHTLLEYKIL